jgi:hypothetical protein
MDQSSGNNEIIDGSIETANTGILRVVADNMKPQVSETKQSDNK